MWPGRQCTDQQQHNHDQEYQAQAHQIAPYPIAAREGFRLIGGVFDAFAEVFNVLADSLSGVAGSQRRDAPQPCDDYKHPNPRDSFFRFHWQTPEIHLGLTHNFSDHTRIAMHAK
jgi:hypothetical protein